MNSPGGRVAMTTEHQTELRMDTLVREVWDVVMVDGVPVRRVRQYVDDTLVAEHTEDGAVADDRPASNEQPRKEGSDDH
jgi:hypothetical protein